MNVHKLVDHPQTKRARVLGRELAFAALGLSDAVLDDVPF